MAERKKKGRDEALLNPSNLGQARRLLNDPAALDEALESGLNQRPDPTFDDTRRRK
jgi:hypothetical protein